MSVEFTVYVGPMFSSKTSKLILKLENFKYQHQKILLFKPVIDKRYNATKVTTHSNWTYDANLVSDGLDILKHIENLDYSPTVVALDEAFMVNKCADSLVWLFRNNMNVVVSTLDMSYDCKPFSEVTKMLPWATQVEKCKSVCTVCGREAAYTYRKTSSSEDILIGGAETYEPRCYLHHPFVKMSD
jgi:thymidine kinase